MATGDRRASRAALVLLGLLIVLTGPIAYGSTAEDWPMFRRDLARTGCSPERILPPYELAWTFSGHADHHIYGSPAVVGEKVIYGTDFLSSNGGYCVCIDTLGAFQWLYNIGGSMGMSSPCVAVGRVYFNGRSATSTRGTFCLDLAGSRIWHQPFPPGVYDLGSNAPVAVADGRVLTHYEYTPEAPSMDSFFCRSATDGSRQWTFANGCWFWGWGAPAVYGSSVFFVAHSQAGSQSGLYKFSLGGTQQGFCHLASPNSNCAPAIADGRAYVTNGSELVCVRTSDLGVAWRQSVSSINGSAAVGNGRVYVGSNEGRIHGFNASSGTPLYDWPKTIGSVVNTPALAEGVVFFGTNNGYFYALDATTGEQLYSHNCGSMVRESPAISRGRIYVGTSNGQLYAFRHGVQSYCDVGVVSIEVPTGVVDSGTVVAPQARVMNYGTQSETFEVTMMIGTWTDTQSMTLPAETEGSVSFASWTAGQRGSFNTRCSTYLVGDEESGNDTLGGSVAVRVRDVEATCVVRPLGYVDSGAVIVPACSVHNRGTSTESYLVRMKISPGYEEAASVTAQAPGATSLVSFPSWTAGAVGVYAVTCSTELAGDACVANDSAQGSVTVGVKDVGCAAIESPSGVVDSGATVQPVCSLYNYGVTTESYSARVQIGAYDESESVTGHAPQTYRRVVFPSWTATGRGNATVSCSTECAGDARPGNDRLLGSVMLQVKDVACAEIVFPSGVVDSGASVTPACSVHNHGTTVPTYAVRMRIGDSYDETATAYNHTPGTAAYLVFPAWAAGARGPVSVRCSTELAGDMVPGNDKDTGLVMVRVIDAAAVEILAPVDSIMLGFNVVPVVRIGNRGTEPATIGVKMLIGDTWARSTSKTVAAVSEDTVGFETWTAGPVGTLVTCCSTWVAGDMDPGNDVLRDSVVVWEDTSGLADAGATCGLSQLTRLDGCRPSLVRDHAYVCYSIGVASHNWVGIYDVRGALVRKLVGAFDEPGNYRVLWNREDGRSRTVPAGIYFCRMLTGEYRATRKLLVVD